MEKERVISIAICEEERQEECCDDVSSFANTFDCVEKRLPERRKSNTQLLTDHPNTSKTNPNSNLVFGVKKQYKEDHVEDLWCLGQSAAANECEAVKCSARERIYQSTQRHPLGKSHPPKGHATLPDFVRQPDFCHGVPTLGGKESAKELLYSAHVVEDEGIRAQYVKSHNSYLPGEQRTRHYRWSINPATTVFGVKGDNIVDPASTSLGASDALHFVRGDDRESISLPVKSPDDDFNPLSDSNANEMKSKRHFVPVSKDHVFGKSAPKAVLDTAANSIFGNRNSDTSSKHDENLGKSITPGFRNAFTETVSAMLFQLIVSSWPVSHQMIIMVLLSFFLSIIHPAMFWLPIYSI